MRNPLVLVIQKELAAFQIKETFLVLAAAVMVPFLVHLVPSYDNVPWGARLLPIFYAPFVAIVFFRPHVGITAALIAPFLNALVTKSPQPDKVLILTAELTIFTCVSYFIYCLMPKLKVNAPISYLLSKAIALPLLLMVTKLTFIRSFYSLLLTVEKAVLGIAILVLINIFALSLKDRLS